MSQNHPPKPKTLGRSSSSLNAPIAAFTMAILLCSYCFSSIRSARREVHTQSSTSASPSSAISGSGSSQQRQQQRLVSLEKHEKGPSWVKQALEKREIAGHKKGKGS